MQIVVDGFPREVEEGIRLADLLRLLGESLDHALVEVNGAYVHAREYEDRELKSGDRVEIIYPAFGG